MAMPAVRRLKLLIAYDGRPFRGWQSQATGDAVQDLVESAFERVLGQKARVHGAGRTDSGVHALGQIAHVDVPANGLPIIRWALALNAHLPDEIRVLKVSRAQADFHAQWDAQGKIYQYRVWNAPAQHPLEIGRAWHLPGPVDIAQLKAAAALLIGRHDFARFAGNRRKGEEDTRRILSELAISRRGPLYSLRFEGDGFLYHMVRLLTGSLFRCAQGRAELTWIADLLAQRTTEKTRYLAPAHGLYLAKVIYGSASTRHA